MISIQTNYDLHYFNNFKLKDVLSICVTWNLLLRVELRWVVVSSGVIVVMFET